MALLGTILLPVLLLVLLLAGLLVATRGPYPVAATVATDPSLPAIDLATVRLHGRVAGPEGAPLVIVLHGGPGADHRSLLALEALSDSHRVLLFDQRGAGLSERVPAGALGVQDYLHDIEALADRFSPDRPVTLVGHSWGAMLAVACMGRIPDRVGRAVLIEPGFLDAAGHAAWEARRRRIARSPRLLAAGLLAGFRSRNVAAPDASAAHDFLIGSVVHAFADHPANPYHCPDARYSAPSWRFGGLASDTFWADPAPALAAMAEGLGHPAPILFLAGGCNDWTGSALQATHAARFPDARVLTVADAGHDVVWDQPAAALAAIRDHLV